jgi:NADH-quinone oxidoreductase subunit G
MSSIKIKVDDKVVEVEEGSLLIDTLKANDFNIPHFCYHEDLGTDGNCRMCLVEIEGQKRPQIACDTIVKEGMSVKTKSKMTKDLQKSILELELLHHPVDCPICDQAGECKLQDYYMDYGLYDSKLRFDKNKKIKKVDLGSNVMHDQERCVLCTRCVRFFPKMVDDNQLGVFTRADHSAISTFPDEKLTSPYSMNVVDFCPVGAMTSKDFRFAQRVWFLKTFDSICGGCSKACNIFVDHSKPKNKEDTIFRFRPRRNVDINKSIICDYGRLSYKNEIENRLLSSTNNIDKNLDDVIETSKNILILVSPMLSLEELKYLKEYALKIKANISAYAPYYQDDSFKDDILKTSDRSPNQNGVKELDIDSSKQYFEDSLKTSDTIIVCENNYFEDDKNQNLLNDKQSIGLFSHIQKVSYDILEPIKSFYEKDGTYINIDGISQTISSQICKDNPQQNINEVLK